MKLMMSNDSVVTLLVGNNRTDDDGEDRHGDVMQLIGLVVIEV